MDFSNIQSNGWGTDQISSTTPLNFTASDMFVTEKVVAASLAWPTPNNRYPDPKVSRPHEGGPPPPSLAAGGGRGSSTGGAITLE